MALTEAQFRRLQALVEQEEQARAAQRPGIGQRVGRALGSAARSIPAAAAATFEGAAEGVEAFMQGEGRRIVSEIPGIVRRAAGRTVELSGPFLANPLARATRMPMIAAETLTSPLSVLAGQLIGGQGVRGEDIGIAAVAPGATRAGVAGVQRLIPGLASRLPGAAAAQQEETIGRGRALVERLRPQNMDELTTATRPFADISVPLDRFRTTLREVEARASGLAAKIQPTEAITMGRQVEGLMERPSTLGVPSLPFTPERVSTRALGTPLPPSPAGVRGRPRFEPGAGPVNTGVMPLRQLQENLSGIGAEIGLLRRAAEGTSGMTRSSTLNLREYRSLYRSLLQGIDDLPQPIPERLQRFRTALRTDFAVSDFERILERPSIIVQRQGDNLFSINGRRLRNAWRKGRDSDFIRESFTPAQRAEIDAFVEEAAALPPLPAPSGVDVGSSRVLTRTMTTGGLVGAALGPQAGAVAAAVASSAPRIIARAVMTPRGRRLIIRLMQEQRPLTPRILQTLATLGREGAIATGVPAGFREGLAGTAETSQARTTLPGTVAAEGRREQASRGIRPDLSRLLSQ